MLVATLVRVCLHYVLVFIVQVVSHLATPTSDVKGKLSSIVLATEQRSGVGDGCTAIDHISFLLHSLMASQGFVPVS